MAGTTSARFGSVGYGTDGFSLKWSARNNGLIRLTEEVTGFFRGGAFQEALARAHEEMAVVAQAGMVERLEGKVRETGRRQRGSRTLELALLHENNREVTASGFLVGRESWLDRSPAELYWRRIEYGDQQTYDSFVLFTNDFSSFYGPWSPGGTSAQSRARNARSGGTSNLYSRSSPKGYKHMRMPQHRGAWVQNIGPYPAYRYSQGAQAAIRDMQPAVIYDRYLSAVGLSFSSVAIKK